MTHLQHMFKIFWLLLVQCDFFEKLTIITLFEAV